MHIQALRLEGGKAVGNLKELLAYVGQVFNAVLDKFRLNTERILGKERAATAIELVQRLEKVKDVAQLMDAVTIASPGKHARSAPVRRGEPALQAG